VAITIKITRKVIETPPPDEPGDDLPQQFWVVLHDAEMGPLWRTGVPEVFVASEIKTDFTASYQRLSYDLNTTQNPLVTANMDKNKWRVFYDFMRWGMNGTGFNKSGDPRRDYVNMRDLDKPLPKFDKARVFGGWLVTGREIYSVVQTLRDAAALMVTMVRRPKSLIGKVGMSVSSLVANNRLELESLSVYDGAPTLAWLLQRPWLYGDAVNVTANGISRFPQGANGSRVFTPFVTSQKVSYPLSQLRKLPAGYDITTHNPYQVNR
jgi:hypothetical protein